MTSITARIAAVLAALLSALFLSSCNSPASDGHADREHTDEPTATVEPAGYNDDDVAFATNMIPHHQQAVDMSALVPDRSTNPQVIELASRISAAQGPEIETLKVFLVQWKENPDASTGHGGHGSMPMSGMVDEATLAMIGHHQGAIEMAKAEIANGENVDAIGLAKTIIDAQQAEIEQMKQMLGGG